MFNILDILPLRPEIKVIDVGAMDLGDDAYAALVRAGLARVVGFECVQTECDRRNAAHRGAHICLPYAIADGRERVLHETNTTMTSSLYEPNTELLAKFHNLANLTQVVRRTPVATKRLDDVAEVAGADFLKIDVQGAELDVIAGAEQTLAEAIVIHTEVEFVPMYKGQPLFAEVDQALRRAGFAFHKFAGIAGRTFQPLVVNNDVNHALSQVLWAEVVYVRDFMRLEALSPQKLLKLATILHLVYGSFDLALAALQAYDAKMNAMIAPAYFHRLKG